ncbi:GGDEF domain-containing protein [Marinomonas posidonica]|uniref:diguanylate cyclase n=1 Tax=Marinomonas posidonica (strain CECT 7376 / NCIMB 14433 / IVIA-Po-181) TaxID=491952 RepID=F6CWF4_MARPP|nr:GGDEF domain-containing protein [Marinomonas posidonica]AEF53209.1 diguanylate cyclase [Marinomonas posidonica IVIA-Po-181]
MSHRNKQPARHPPIMEPKVFRRLLVLACISFMLIWLIDESSGIISQYDAAAYPICICAFAAIYVASRYSSASWQNNLHLLTYLIVAGYLISTSIWHHIGSNALFSNAAQWLGLNYVIAYLFLEVKRAASTTILILAATLIGHYVVLIQNHGLEDTIGVVLNIAVAHIVYIILLWTVVRLRVKAAQANTRINLLENYAYVDLLTGILNRRGMEKVFDELGIDQIKTGSQRYALMIIDIDYFKQVNDQFGHAMGDKILTKVAAKLNRTIRPEDVLGRWGGEEFVVLTLNRTPQEVLALAEQLRFGISQLSLEDVSDITVSIGIGFSDLAKTRQEVFTIADSNLYEAKQSGRDSVRCSI